MINAGLKIPNKKKRLKFKNIPLFFQFEHLGTWIAFKTSSKNIVIQPTGFYSGIFWWIVLLVQGIL
jgi:hypothetical protein